MISASLQEKEEENNRAVSSESENRTLKLPTHIHWKAESNVGTTAESIRSL